MFYCETGHFICFDFYTACKNITHDENIPFIFQLTLPDQPVFMQKISITFRISKLSIEKFYCSACTTSLETLQEIFFYHQFIFY